MLAMAAFPLGLIGAFFVLREPMEPLTHEVLANAKQLWDSSGVRSYDLSYQMHGSYYEVVVRDGIVTSATVNGQPVRTAEIRAYAIDGLFDMLALELDNLDNPAGPFAGSSGSVLMRVRFHDQLGYVERYLRGSGGVGRSVSLEQLVFTKVP